MKSSISKAEYLNKKKAEIHDILTDRTLSNFFYQASAQKIGARFTPTFKEEYLWRKALILSSHGGKILLNEPDYFEASKAVHLAARIYEILHYISEEYDKEYCVVLSSLCYDIAGYHANALCLIKNLYHLEKNQDNYEYENQILDFIQLFMIRKLSTLSELALQADSNSTDNVKEIFIILSNFFLNGTYVKNLEELNNFDVMVEEKIDVVFSEYLYIGDIMFSNLFFLFKVKYKLFVRKSIWHNFYKYERLPNKIWDRYAKILSHNMYSDGKIIASDQRISIIEFWNSQVNALNKGILNTNDNFIIQMPTSAGKTFIAEMIILNNLTQSPGKKCLYIAPFKSLVSQVEETLSDHLGRMGFVVSTIIGNYELDSFDNLLIYEADVLVATPEKIDLLLRLMPEFFDNVSNITFDEGHVLGNLDTRSSLMEFLITRLRQRLKDRVSFIFISAVMPDISVAQISQWLSIKSENKITSKNSNGEKWQPTRNLIGKFEWHSNSGWLEYPTLRVSAKANAFVPSVIESKRYKYLNPKTNRNNTVSFPKTTSKSETAVELAYKFADQGPVLVFCGQPRNANSVAKAYIEMIRIKTISKNIKLENSTDYTKLNSYELASKVLGKDSDTVLYLSHGIGVHTGSLPQVVRKAIEQDYKNKKLELLVATNTLGQGVNLPIKTIIIHSVNIAQGQPVSNRDFWNIIGRAGRAGKETEGQVIYLCNSDNDRDLFSNYIDESKIEPINSIFYQIVKALSDKRIDNDQLRELLAETIEPQLFALLVEEMVDSPDEEIINKMIGTTLFNIQLADEPHVDDSELANELVNISNRFYTAAPNYKKRNAFARTGFSLSSCIKLHDYIENAFGNLYEKVQTNIIEFILDVLNNIKGIQEMQSYKDSINELCQKDDIFNTIITMWLKEDNITEIRSFIRENDIQSSVLLNEFIESMLSYRYSWGVTAFIVVFKYEIEERGLTDLDLLNYIPSFVKHGTNGIPTSWAKSLGIPTRESASVIGNYYYEKLGGTLDLKKFVQWFSNITKDELKEILNMPLTYEFEVILNIAQKINNRKYYDIEDNQEYRFYVMGIKYYTESIELAQRINMNDKVSLLRDYDNLFDSYAVMVMYQDIFLGYVPRELAKEISVQMDMNGFNYNGHVLKKRKKSTGIDIFVSVTLDL